MKAVSSEFSFDPLTPLSFLHRAAAAHGDRVGVIDGPNRWTYDEFRQRCSRLAAGLARLARDAPVAVLAPNTHVSLETTFAVPWAGLPLVPLNTRLAPLELAHILQHCEASVLIYDAELSDLVAETLRLLSTKPTVLSTGEPLESLIAGSTPIDCAQPDERSLLSINYTSGTTGAPKGVMYHHRGAYLQTLAMMAHSALSPSSVHLWTVPMFHCHGWGFTWAVTAAGGTHVCLPKVDPDRVWQAIREDGVTHLNGAPTVLTMLAYAQSAGDGVPEGRRVQVATGGAPPTPSIVRRMQELGFDISHLYGLTETFGPVLISDWRPEWDGLDEESRARLRARQGVGTAIACHVRVVADDGSDVPADGKSLGQIALRGNNLMSGYFKDAEATRRAVPDEWFRTGDIGVMHPDGYIEIHDREKDIIISGGENIASIEVEQLIANHPGIAEVAVVAMPDTLWGDVPVAFVTLRHQAVATEAEIIEFVRARIARFKAPKRVIFGEMPKTSTGKIRKDLLRRAARASLGYA